MFVYAAKKYSPYERPAAFHREKYFYFYYAADKFLYSAITNSDI